MWSFTKNIYFYLLSVQYTSGVKIILIIAFFNNFKVKKKFTFYLKKDFF